MLEYIGKLFVYMVIMTSLMVLSNFISSMNVHLLPLHMCYFFSGMICLLVGQKLKIY